MKTESAGNVTSVTAQPKNKQGIEQRSAKAEEAHNQLPESALSGIEASKQALNASILKASAEVTLSAGNNSLSLLFKTAIENLNQVLAPEFGENAIQATADSGLDFSPQATADRIVSLSTAFFDKYADSHPEKDLETALNDFTKLIGSGIDKGFSEAREILDGLKVLEGDIASNVDKTYELVQSGIKSFIDNYPRPDQAGEATAKSRT